MFPFGLTFQLLSQLDLEAPYIVVIDFQDDLTGFKGKDLTSQSPPDLQSSKSL